MAMRGCCYPTILLFIVTTHDNSVHLLPMTRVKPVWDWLEVTPYGITPGCP